MTPMQQAAELKSLLPVILEKEKAGLILPSYAKATDLVRWAEAGKPVSEKQALFMGRLILRAKRKHKNATVTVQAEKADVDGIVKKVLERVGTEKIDTSAVVEAVMGKIDAKAFDKVAKQVIEALDARVAKKVEITVTLPDGKKTVTKGPRHHMFEKLVRCATARLDNGFSPGIFLAGEASSGKTTGCRQLAEALKLDWHFNGAISFPHEMLGFIDGAGKYHSTPFRKAYENGGVYTFDEVDRSDPVALLAVNPHLANGVATFPDKQIKRHKDCIIVCTANTWGLGADANYSGATKLDAAFLSRFPVRLAWDIDEKLEDEIVGHAEWLGMVRKARAKARIVGLKVMIDTRAAIAGAALVRQGFSLGDAADMTYLANLKPQQRQQLETF